MIANKLPATFVLFHVLSLWVCPRSLSTLDSSHVRKYQALHACTTSIFSFRRVGAWERGYNYHTLLHRNRRWSMLDGVREHDCALHTNVHNAHTYTRLMEVIPLEVSQPCSQGLRTELVEKKKVLYLMSHPAVLFKALILLVNMSYTTICAYAPLS